MLSTHPKISQLTFFKDLPVFIVLRKVIVILENHGI